MIGVDLTGIYRKCRFKHSFSVTVNAQVMKQVLLTVSADKEYH